MKQDITKELFAYWNTQRGRRTSPERMDIDPSAIRTLLADTFILDYDAEAGFPFRIAGTRTNSLLDREMRLKSFTSLWRASDQPQINNLIASVSGGSIPILCGVTAQKKGRRLDMELLLLPLRHHGETHSRLMGCLVPLTTPEWLGLIPIGELELVSARILEQKAQAEKLSITEVNFRNSSHIHDRIAPTNNSPIFIKHDSSHLSVIEGGR